MAKLLRYFAEELDTNRRNAVEAAVADFDKCGRVLWDGRNTIREIDGLVVKRYRRPCLLQRLVYSFIRKPKGLRAFRNPGRMATAGVGSPAALAYFEERRNGLIDTSFFVSELSPLSCDFYCFGNNSMDAESDRRIVKAFVADIVRMHEAGILHRDLTPGNILWAVDAEGKARFEFIDTNRMSFGRVSLRRGIRNFARLWGQPAMFGIIASEYASLRGGDCETLYKELMAARRRFWRRFSRRHQVKYRLEL